MNKNKIKNMDNSNLNEENIYQTGGINNKNHWWLWLVVAVVVVAVGFIIWWLLGQTGRKAVVVPEGQEAQKQQVPMVHSYVGQVLKVAGDRIVIQVEAHKNEIESDKLMTVRFNEQTFFSEHQIPQQLTGDSEQDKIQVVKVDQNSLAEDQEVVVYAFDNIYDKDIFTANKIEILSVE